MKQRRRTPRKPFRQPPKRLPPAPPPWLDPVGTPDGPLPLRAQAHLKSEGGLRAVTIIERAARHEEMLRRIEFLESLIAKLPKQQPGIGHNRPPITKEDVQEITQAIAILKAQPAIGKARAAGSTLMRFGERLGTYLLNQADVFVSEAVKSGGKEFGKRLVQSPFWWALATALMLVGQSVSNWLH
jgi:hypothetical protein